MSSRTPEVHGPGITYLAERLGESPDAVASDPKVLARALRVFGREAADLVRAYASDDPSARADAERRWAAIAARFPQDDKGAGGDVFRARLNRILTDAVERLEQLVREGRERDADAASPSADGEPRV